jgi:hypothetical protein
MRFASDRGVPLGAPSASLTRRALALAYEALLLFALSHALNRSLFAAADGLLAGAGFLWALVDREGLFLHDRLAGTKIVRDDL